MAAMKAVIAYGARFRKAMKREEVDGVVLLD
jgi:hypothetical protein